MAHEEVLLLTLTPLQKIITLEMDVDQPNMTDVVNILIRLFLRL